MTQHLPGNLEHDPERHLRPPDYGFSGVTTDFTARKGDPYHIHTHAQPAEPKDRAYFEQGLTEKRALILLGLGVALLIWLLLPTGPVSVGMHAAASVGSACLILVGGLGWVLNRWL